MGLVASRLTLGKIHAVWNKDERTFGNQKKVTQIDSLEKWGKEESSVIISSTGVLKSVSMFCYMK